ncbi:aminotransferase class V-fold PLP-dependent enzyme [Paenibacillus sp. N1-5-1-14]|uniref:aminotransferase class V-fold PLP-dependent enzyme n=1 Tax=Paenibacillus radicibacter TaxID=2972488 RepID=UPI0021592C24|nr:aminotransferase class V-fold PLP-dependent enzyme [Paenibacillus radicibacter]MCR8642998.1 aminotransferase class V-fold PLP-dependent enzyme [Paenibacillus radicibacter]
MDIKYFDHAASSWPKPPEVIEAMTRNLSESGANPGRGSHAMAVKASRVLFETRRNAAKLFGVRNPNDISFALNTTAALNLAILGFVREGAHVISTAVEHNSVRRPLEYLKRTRNVSVTYVSADIRGRVKVADVEAAIRPNTELVVVNHSSNLLGTVQPVPEIGAMCRRHGVRLLVDAAQSAGILPIDVDAMGIDMLAFPGHKGLLGPQGTGGLYIHPDLELEPLMHGGTGSQSEALEQPKVRPDRYEAGTPNTVGIAGLNEGIKYVLSKSVESIHAHEWALSQRLMEGLVRLPGVQLLGPEIGELKTGIVAFNIEGADSSEISFVLDQSFGIAVRAGYHCTPLAHEAIGTLANGAVRASVGYATTTEDVDYFIEAIKEIVEGYLK